MVDVPVPGFFLRSRFLQSFRVAPVAWRFSVFGFAHRSRLEFDAVGVVNKAVQDTVGDGGITDLIVQLSDRHLAGENRRACLVAVIADFQKVAALTVGQWSHGPIIDQEDIDVGNAVQKLAEAAVGAGNGQITKQTGSADVKRGESIADRLLSQSTGDETFGRRHMVP